MFEPKVIVSFDIYHRGNITFKPPLKECFQFTNNEEEELGIEIIDAVNAKFSGAPIYDETARVIEHVVYNIIKSKIYRGELKENFYGNYKDNGRV